MLSVALSCLLLTGFLASPVLGQAIDVEQGNIIKLILGIVIGVTVAGALLPGIFNDTATLETDSAGDLDTSEEGLIGVWNILIIVAVMMAIVGFVV